MAKALAAAQAEVEALKAQAGQLQGGGGATTSTCSSAAGQAAAAGGRRGMSPGRKWALVGALQVAGLVAYCAAAEMLGCA